MRHRKSLTVTLPESTLRRLEELADETGLPRSRVVELAIGDWRPVIATEEIATRGAEMLAASATTPPPSRRRS